MIVVGVVLVALATLVLLAAVLGGSNDDTMLDFGIVEVTTTVMGVFLIGAATVLVFVLGLGLVRSGARRSWRRRRELKHARAVVADQDRHEDGAAPTGGRAEGHQQGEAATHDTTEPGPSAR